MKVSTIVSVIEHGAEPYVSDSVSYSDDGTDGLNIFPAGKAGSMFAVSVADWHRLRDAVEEHLRKRAADRHAMATEGYFEQEESA